MFRNTFKCQLKYLKSIGIIEKSLILYSAKYWWGETLAKSLGWENFGESMENRQICQCFLLYCIVLVSYHFKLFQYCPSLETFNKY